jgi:acyl dehydratase
MSHTFESLEIGQSFSFTRNISAEDVLQFAAVTGDDNPIHVDPVKASESRFGGRVVHGVFLLGVISKVLVGRDFPGPGSIAVSISSRFLRPVPVDSDVTIEVKIAEKIASRRHIKARVYAYVENKVVLGVEAVLIPPGENWA